MKKRVLIIFIIFIIVIVVGFVSAADYYISPIGTASWSQCININTPCSLSTANANAQAGDTIYMRGGTYTGQQIAPSNSGTANNNRIIYQNYNNEVVTIRDADTPLLLSNRNYVTITGSASQNIIITNCDKYLTMDNGDYNILAYLTIGPMRNYDRFEGFRIGPDASYNWRGDLGAPPINKCFISHSIDCTEECLWHPDNPDKETRIERTLKAGSEKNIQQININRRF